MLKSKERAYLRGLANKVEAIFQIGKSGITPEFTEMVDNALEARELIKISILETAGITAKEAAEVISARTHSDVVQIIGGRFSLYRRSKKRPVIELPKIK